MAVADSSSKDHHGDSKHNPQWIYGLQLAEDQIYPTLTLISPCCQPQPHYNTLAY